MASSRYWLRGLACVVVSALNVAVVCGQAATSKGYFLGIGLNSVNPERYSGWRGDLEPCENDVRKVQSLLVEAGGFESPRTLLTESAKCADVGREVGAIAQEAKSGDLVVIFFSGHGGQVFDTNGDEKSNGPYDLMDETWCLYDRQLIDDELHEMIRKCKRGVRVLVLSDSCHSGSMTKEAVQVYLAGWAASSANNLARSIGTSAEKGSPQEDGFSLGSAFARSKVAGLSDQERRKALLGIVSMIEEPKAAPMTSDLGLGSFKAMPPHVVVEAWSDNADLYKEAQAVAGDEKAPFAAGVLLISGCQDNQLSLAPQGLGLSLFTYQMVRVWKNGAFAGSYEGFRDQIVALMPPTQTPNLYGYGDGVAEFRKQRPFMVK